MNFFLTMFFLILIVGVLVFVHELGHFLAAKLSGVAVLEFAIGFGPNLYTRTFKGTKYAIKLLPLGGYVQLEGETEDEGPNSYKNKRFRVKAFVLLAGIFMNLLLAVILLAFYLNNHGYKFAVPKLVEFTFSGTDIQESYFPLTVTFIDPEGPSVGQLNLRDNVVAVDGVKFNNFNEFLDIIKSNQEKEVSFTFLNFDDFTTSTRNIKLSKADENGSILKAGLSSYDNQTNKPTYFIKYKDTVISGFSMTYDFFIYQFKALGSLLKNALQTGNYTEVSKNVGGLPSIGNQINQVVEYQAFDILVPLTALFSVNLAMINIIPFPALDGGQLLFAAIEKLTKRKIPDQIRNRIDLVGFSLLMGLGLLVTIKDVIQLSWLDSIGQFIQNVLGK